MVQRRIRKQRMVSVVVDGGSNVNRASIMNYTVVAPGMPSLLWKSVATGTARHDAQTVAQDLEGVVDEIEDATGATVASAQADNAKNMVKALDTLEEKRAILGAVNLLIQDVCKYPEVASVKKKAVEITKWFWAHLAPLDHLRHLQKGLPKQQALVQPVPTRWYSVPACLNSVLTNKTVIKKILDPPNRPSNPSQVDRARFERDLLKRCSAEKKQRLKIAELQGYIRDKSFWRSLKEIVALLDPIVDALRVLESDTSYASQVYEEFFKLLANDVYSADDTPYEANNPSADSTAVHAEDDDNAFVDYQYDEDNEDEELEESDAEAQASDDAASEVSQVEERIESDPDQDDEDDHNTTVVSVQHRGRYQNRPSNTDLSLPARFYVAIKKRWEVVHTDAMGIAFLLDPRKDLRDFVGDDQDQSIQQACDFAERSKMLERLHVGYDEFLAALYAFTSEKSTLATTTDAKGITKREKLAKTSPRDWWVTARSRHPLLAELAERVFAIPTSSAAVERSFSIQDFIHRKKRNRLSNDKAFKLTYCYINYGTLWRDSLDLARVECYPTAYSFSAEDGDAGDGDGSDEPGMVQFSDGTQPAIAASQPFSSSAGSQSFH